MPSVRGSLHPSVALVHRQFGYLFRPLFAFEEYLSVVGLDEPYYHVEGSGLPHRSGPADRSFPHRRRLHLIDDGARLIFFDESGGVKPHFFKKLFYKVSQILEKVLSLCCERMLGIIVRSFRAFYIERLSGVLFLVNARFRHFSLHGSRFGSSCGDGYPAPGI